MPFLAYLIEFPTKLIRISRILKESDFISWAQEDEKSIIMVFFLSYS